MGVPTGLGPLPLPPGVVPELKYGTPTGGVITLCATGECPDGFTPGVPPLEIPSPPEIPEPPPPPPGEAVVPVATTETGSLLFYAVVAYIAFSVL